MPRVKKLQIQSVKGMHDILPHDQQYWEFIIKKAKGIFEDYSFRRIDTPILEQTDLFVRSVGEATDIVEKEMYNLRTKGGDRLSLRPEFTAGIVRAYIEHGMHTMPHPVQLWTHGPLFRHENPQAGRLRQHYQLNLEIFGDEMPAADAQAIFIQYKILESLGVKNLIVKLNSIGDADCRPQYIKALKDHYRGSAKRICAQCLKRIKSNPLRVLDCKKPDCQEHIKNAPQFLEYLDEDCKKHFKGVLEFLDELEVPYLLDHTLVRGLDYYTRTTFEIIVEKENEKEEKEDEKKEGEEEEKKIKTKKENEKPKSEPLALGGGGRYDKLVEHMGGPKTPAIGWGMGIERIILALKIQKIEPASSKKPPKVFIAQLGELAKRKSLALFEEFRRSGVSAKSSFGRDSIKAQLRVSNRLNIPYTIIMGQKEALDGSVIIREMGTGVQETVPVEKVIEIIKQKTKGR
ncbi:MAG: histidine--tRNA ligase [Parcubacteria group bacterium]